MRRSFPNLHLAKETGLELVTSQGGNRYASFSWRDSSRNQTGAGGGGSRASGRTGVQIVFSDGQRSRDCEEKRDAIEREAA
jgi:hypothetical protein